MPIRGSEAPARVGFRRRTRHRKFFAGINSNVSHNVWYDPWAEHLDNDQPQGSIFPVPSGGAIPVSAASIPITKSFMFFSWGFGVGGGSVLPYKMPGYRREVTYDFISICQ